jgi:hypothetical protein
MLKKGVLDRVLTGLLRKINAVKIRPTIYCYFICIKSMLHYKIKTILITIKYSHKYGHSGDRRALAVRNVASGPVVRSWTGVWELIQGFTRSAP